MLRLPATCLLLSTPAVADYSLAITDTGKRDYYCTITVALTNDSDAHLTEINAFFLNYIGDKQVGGPRALPFSMSRPALRCQRFSKRPTRLAPRSSVTT
ncbi:hypothetical protein [uncultured Tateyamaria sp.]|uniref:hypothetical protein n=1 Tax=uncultured Tateyamaria sp. TaxID=455651 RepID=UPI00260E1545|nr:hypothetical protein [uncultured Tateyamaria sp.]